MNLPEEGNLAIDEDVEVEAEADLPTLTYKLDFKRGKCVGYIDGREAMEQAIYKVLHTKRFAHLIYTDDYGFENMVGFDRLFVQGELPRRIEEALLQDDRITEVQDLNIEFVKDEAFISLTAITIYGDVEVLKEVIPIV